MSKGVDYLKILVVRPGIAPYEAEISDGGNIYQEMREIIGGPPQLCYPFEEQAALVYNKEWITQNTPFNRAVNSKQGVVFGTFIICGTDGGDLCSLTPEQAAYYKGMYHHAEIFVGTQGRSQIILMTDPVEKADGKETT